MLSSPLSDLHKPEPLRDDLFGHGHGFGDERPPDVDKMWKDFNRRLNRLFRLKKKKDDEPERSDRVMTRLMTGRHGRVLSRLWLASSFLSQRFSGWGQVCIPLKKARQGLS